MRSSPRPSKAPEPVGFHVTFRLEDSRPLAITVAALRAIASVMLAQGEARGLLAFGTADDHLHALLVAARAAAGAFALYVETSLRRQLGLAVRFERARIRPLHDQSHAYNAFRYVLRQDVHHGLDRDSAREGTSLPDYLGLRLLPTSIWPRVRTHLPRVRIEELLGHFPSGAFEANRPVDLNLLADAAAAAFALPDLHGQSPDVVRARRAAVHVAGPEVPTGVLSDCLGVGPRAIRALRLLPSEPLVVRAVHKQALLRTPTRKLTDAA